MSFRVDLVERGLGPWFGMKSVNSVKDLLPLVRQWNSQLGQLRIGHGQQFEQSHFLLGKYID